MYDIYIEKAAERDLKKLPAADFERIIPHLKSLAEVFCRFSSSTSSTPPTAGSTN